MAKSKFFRVAVEGPTVDGRNIEREWLEQMAASYDPATLTARINCEHIPGYSPDKPFNAYGSVSALKTEEVELNVNGEPKRLLALYAQIEANDQLVEINKADQKIFTSCEIHPNFAGEGKAYLVGLAVTDTPASLGTEPLKFAARYRPNVFSTAHETAMEMEPSLDGATIEAATTRGFLAALGTLFKTAEKPVQQPTPATPPATPANDNSFDVGAFASVMGQQVALAVKPSNDAVTALGQRFDALEAKLNKTPEPQTFSRPLATGGNGGTSIVTDC